MCVFSPNGALHCLLAFIAFCNVSDFSLSEWLEDKGTSGSVSVVPKDMVNSLLKDLGIAKYRLRESCTVLSPAWKSGMNILKLLKT